MPRVERLASESYRRIPWKNGRGELIVIDLDGEESWEHMGVAWHFGRTAIIEEGPFSDYTGYERLQVVIRGTWLVLIAPDHEIDLRVPMRPQRYDGGLPVRTVLEHGSVQVVNLIANRTRFDIEMRIGKTGAEITCKTGRHIVYAPTGTTHVTIDGHTYTLAEDHALRLRINSKAHIAVQDGPVIVGSIHDKP